MCDKRLLLEAFDALSSARETIITFAKDAGVEFGDDFTLTDIDPVIEKLAKELA